MLPPGATAGTIVNIAVHRNHAEEKRRDEEFWGLQKVILEEFGMHSPEPPDLQVRGIQLILLVTYNVNVEFSHFGTGNGAQGILVKNEVL